jgi:hypothetical protein
MSLISSLVYVVASLSGIVASWYILKRITPWVQAYRNWQDTKDVSDARQTTLMDDQKANLESDKLNKIDGQ